MTHETTVRPPRTRTMWLGTLWFLGVTLGAAVIRRSLAPDGALVVASIFAIGTIGMAWLTMRATDFPVVSWLGTSALMGLAIVGSALIAPQPAHAKDFMETGWMFPWLFLLMGSTPGPKKGWCAPTAPWSGWLLFGMGLLYTVILLGATWLSRRF